MILRIESGESEGSKASRQAIADALGCTLAELYRDTNTRLPSASNLADAADVLSRLSSLSPERLTAVYALIFDDLELARKAGVSRLLLNVK